MITTLLFLIVTSLLGAWVSYFTSCLRGLTEKCGLALVVGLVIQLWLPFATSKMFGIAIGPWLALGISSFLLLTITLRWRHQLPDRDGLLATGREFLLDRHRLGNLLFLIALLTFLGVLFHSHSLAPTKDGLTSAGVAWEDQSYHAMLASSFLYSHNLERLSYPHFDGWPLGYPFLSDLLAATLTRLGATLGQAFWLSAWYAATTFILLLWALAKNWAGGKTRASLAVTLFLCAGGFGVVDFLRELLVLGWPEALIRHDYANGWELGLHYHNPLTGVLLPMRTSLFGMPIALAIILITTRLIERGSVRRDWLLAGLLTGFLPLIHAHSFLVVAWFSLALAALNWRILHWSRIGFALAPLFLLAIPQLLWTRSQMVISDPPFIRFYPGWICEAKTIGGWLFYWLHNGGLFLLLGILSWCFSSTLFKKRTFPLLALLVIGNLVAFQPSPYDNIKLFVYTNAALAILLAGQFARLWSRHRTWKISAAMLIIATSLSGILSIWRETRLESLIVSWEGVAFAEMVKKNTPLDSVFLTSSELTHPVPVLTGRPLVLGYLGWLAQHGVPIGTRADDVKAIYNGSPAARDLLKKYHVSYVVIGPPERREFPELNETFLGHLATTTFTLGEYTLYELEAPQLQH